MSKRDKMSSLKKAFKISLTALVLVAFAEASGIYQVFQKIQLLDSKINETYNKAAKLSNSLPNKNILFDLESSRKYIPGNELTSIKAGKAKDGKTIFIAKIKYDKLYDGKQLSVREAVLSPQKTLYLYGSAQDFNPVVKSTFDQWKRAFLFEMKLNGGLSKTFLFISVFLIFLFGISYILAEYNSKSRDEES